MKQFAEQLENMVRQYSKKKGSRADTIIDFEFNENSGHIIFTNWKSLGKISFDPFEGKREYNSIDDVTEKVYYLAPDGINLEPYNCSGHMYIPYSKKQLKHLIGGLYVVNDAYVGKGVTMMPFAYNEYHNTARATFIVDKDFIGHILEKVNNIFNILNLGAYDKHPIELPTITEFENNK